MTPKPNMPLPQPRPDRAGRRTLMLFALLLLLAAGGAGFWLTLDDAQRQAYKDTLARWLADTPLAPLTAYLHTPTPPTPERVTNPSTQPGTLAGQTVLGNVPSLPDPSLPPEGQDASKSADTAPEIPPVIAPAVTEDSVVGVRFVEDAAQWLVARFQPDKDGGTLQVNVQSLNLRFGGQMPGLTRPENVSRETSNRAAVLRYAFNPPMLTALYTLYRDRFIEALRQAAAQPREGKVLTQPQTDALYKACAGRFAAYADALRALGAMTDFDARMRHAATLSKQAMDAHQQMTEAIFALDSARESGSTARMEAAQLRVSGLNAQYQKHLEDYRAAQNALCADWRKAAPGASSLNNETLLYIAAWVERRGGVHPHNQEAVLTTARLFEDLAQRLRTLQ